MPANILHLTPISTGYGSNYMRDLILYPLLRNSTFEILTQLNGLAYDLYSLPFNMVSNKL